MSRRVSWNSVWETNGVSRGLRPKSFRPRLARPRTAVRAKTIWPVSRTSDWANISRGQESGDRGRGFQLVDFVGEGVADFEPACVRHEPAINGSGERLMGFDAEDGFVAADHFVMRATGADHHRECDWQQFRHRE